jgi:hypothetical protein
MRPADPKNVGAERGGAFTVDDVMTAFHRVTGDRLLVGRTLDLRRFRGGVSQSLTISSEATADYGEFRFVVESEPAADRVFSVLQRPDVRPDRDGIHWAFQPKDEFGGNYWSATMYAGNVKVIWFSPEKVRTAGLELLLETMNQLRRQIRA